MSTQSPGNDQERLPNGMKQNVTLSSRGSDAALEGPNLPPGDTHVSDGRSPKRSSSRRGRHRRSLHAGAFGLMIGSLLGLALLITLRPDLNPSLFVTRAFASRERAILPGGTWITYANGDAAQSLAVQGDYLWVGTHLGGLVRWDPTDQTYVQYLYPQTDLPSNDVRAIDTDATGRLWIGTSRGLAVLSADDAHHTGVTGVMGTIVVHHTGNSGLPADVVTDVGVAPDGKVWVATDGGGLAVLDDKGTTQDLSDDEWTVYGLDDGLPSYLVTALDFDDVGNVWIGTKPYPNPDPEGSATLGGGVSIFNGLSFFNYHTQNSTMGSNVIVTVCPGGGEEMWVATRGGGVTLFQGRQGNQTFNKNNSGLTGNDVSACAQDTTGRMWFAVIDSRIPQGVSVLNNDVWANLTKTNSGLISNSVSAIVADSSRRVWFGHKEVYGGTQGVSLLTANGQDWTTYDTSTGLPSDSINSITQDTIGNLWFGTNGRGVMAYQRGLGHWIYYDRIITGGELPSNIVRDIAVDQVGRLWLATDRGGSTGAVSWTAYTRATTGDGLRTDNLQTVAVDDTGKIWFGHAQGIDVLDHHGTPHDPSDDTWRSISGALPGPSVRDITRDASGRMWVATNYGVGVYDGTQWRTYQAPNLVSNDVHVVFPDSRSGQIWVGTANGVSVLDEDTETWTSYTTADGLVYNNIQAIYVDTWQRVWFGTLLGVSIKDGDDWLPPYTSTNSGLAGNDVTSLLVDGWGLVWLGTRSDGISVFDSTTWDHLTSADHGLPSNRITDIVFGADGSTWVGTADRGFSALHGTTWTTYSRASTGDQLASDKVRTIAIEADGHVWVGTLPFVSGGWWSGGGISVLDPKSGAWTTYNRDNTGATGLGGNFIQKIAIDAAGRVWIGTGVPNDEPAMSQGYGLTVYDHGSWTTYTRGNTDLNLSSDRIPDISLDSQGRVWLATQPYVAGLDLAGGGVSRLDLGDNGVPDPPGQGDDEWASWTNGDDSGLVAVGHEGDVWAVHVDRADTIWAGGWTCANPPFCESVHWPNRLGVDGSLNEFIGPLWMAHEPFLEAGPISSIASDADNGLWVGTAWDGARYFDGKGWQSFTTADYPLVSDDITVIRVDSQGDVWFGTADAGISRYTPPPPTPTPTPSSTPTETHTPGPPTPTATFTATAIRTPTATPTATVAATATATPSPTPTQEPRHYVYLPAIWKSP